MKPSVVGGKLPGTASMIARRRASLPTRLHREARPRGQRGIRARVKESPSLSSRPKSRDPYVDGPRLARAWQGAARIAIDHMSGLLIAGRLAACQDGYRYAGSEHTRDVKHRRVPRSVSRLGSIDHAICSVSSKLRPQREAMVALAPNSLCLVHRGLWRSRGAQPQRGALRGALTKRSAALLAVHGRRAAAPEVECSIVAFAADHQLPDNASGFVGRSEERR